MTKLLLFKFVYYTVFCYFSLKMMSLAYLRQLLQVFLKINKIQKAVLIKVPYQRSHKIDMNKKSILSN